MDAYEHFADARLLSSHLRRRADSMIAEFEAAIGGLSEDADDVQRERMRSAAKAIMKLSARILIELE
jgi:hypothetical protein